MSNERKSFLCGNYFQKRENPRFWIAAIGLFLLLLAIGIVTYYLLIRDAINENFWLLFPAIAVYGVYILIGIGVIMIGFAIWWKACKPE